MFHNRALAACVARSIIYFTLILSGPAEGRTAVAQELSPTILQLIPRVFERLHSEDIYERISVLGELVRIKRDGHLPELAFPYDLPASDYSVVVKSILAGNLEEVDERRASTTWWKLNHVARVFRLKEVVKPLTGYLPKSAPPVQLDILQTLKTLQAVEGVPQIVTLLQSREEYIRREALDTLVSLRAMEGVPSLVALLQDKDALKRYYALTSLVEVNGREAAPAIAKALEDESEDNRYWALDALVKLNAREHALAVWKLTNADQRPQTEAYALAALISFAEPRAIPLAVKRATEGDLTRRTDMLNFLIKVKASAIAPAFVAVLESRTVLGGNPSDTGTDSNIRRDIMTCLGQLRAREAIPVLRGYARGRDSNTFLQRAAVMTLGALGAREAVNDLLPLLDERVTGDVDATAETGFALAQIGDRRTWRQLIDLAARPSCPYSSEIISELNRHLDPELWERIQTQKVPGLYVKSVKATVETFGRKSGIRIVLDYQPGRDSSPRASLDGDGYPWANTSVEEISLSYGLRQIIEGLGDDRTPRTFTFIFDYKQIHILSVERAIGWWRKQILSKYSY
jgi:HEAT repeat protein